MYRCRSWVMVVELLQMMDPRMDRGMMRVEGRTLEEYRDHALAHLIPTSPLATSAQLSPERLLAYFQTLFQLYVSWLSGLPSASTLLTCLALHGECTTVADGRLRWMMEAVRRAALMMADLTMRTNVARSDEFYPGLHGLAEESADPFAELAIALWPSVFDKAATPTPTAPTITTTTTMAPTITTTTTPFTPESICNEARRMRLWLQLLQLLRMVRFDYHLMLAIIDELVAIPFSRPAPVASALVQDELFVVPELANLYGVGCVRRRVLLLGLEECQAFWHSMLVSYRPVIESYQRVAPFWETLPPLMRLSASSSPHANPALRTLCFAAFLDFELVYGYFPSSQYAHMYFGDGAVERLVLDAIQIACHSTARQRRLIPKWLRAAQRHPRAGRLDHLARWMAAWYVALGFQLDLYEMFERHEAYVLLTRMAREDSPLHRLASSLRRVRTDYRRTYSVYDDCRRHHRWQCLQGLISIADLDLDVARDVAAGVRTETPAPAARIFSQCSDLLLNDPLHCM